MWIPKSRVICLSVVFSVVTDGKAVEAVAMLGGGKDNTVGPILSEIHESLVKAQAKALTEYRTACAHRHSLLH